MVNRSPASAIGFKTSKEVWSGHPTNYCNLKIFCCPAYCYVKQGKLDPRVARCIFLGYETGVKGYRLWCVEPKNQKLYLSKDVTFDESVMLSPRQDSVVSSVLPGPTDVLAQAQVEVSSIPSQSVSSSIPLVSVPSSSIGSEEEVEDVSTTVASVVPPVVGSIVVAPAIASIDQSIAKNRPRREIRRPRHL